MKVIKQTLIYVLASLCISCGVNTSVANSSPPQTANGNLKYTAPSGWQVETTSSAMRVAQYKLPRAEGDNEDASLVLYFFGANQGGSVQANIDRWIGQIVQPDGTASKDKAKTEEMTVNGLKLTSIDLSGTYTAETAPGSGTRFNKPGYRLRAAVVETPKGPYFIKLVGPEKTISRWNSAFLDYLKSFDFK
jgi:hypothetical protein